MSYLEALMFILTPFALATLGCAFYARHLRRKLSKQETDRIILALSSMRTLLRINGCKGMTLNAETGEMIIRIEHNIDLRDKPGPAPEVPSAEQKDEP